MRAIYLLAMLTALFLLAQMRSIARAYMDQGTVTDAFSVVSKAATRTVNAGQEAGFDRRRISTSSGLHIVPLDQSPFVGSLAGQIRGELLEQMNEGMHTATMGSVPDMRQVTRHASGMSFLPARDTSYQSLTDIRPHLRYEPISVNGTALDGVPLVEATTGGGLEDGRWTGVTRSWEVAGLGFVQLDESEYRETGGSITVVKEWINTEVNGHPATIQTARSEDGATRVSLGWVTESTVLRLDLQPLNPDALQANQDALLSLARGLGG